MPNWCENKLTVTAPTPELLIYLKEHGFSFARIVPVDSSGDDFAAVSRQTHAWGTKWDLSDTEGNLAAADLTATGETYFNTAWSPPLPVIEALSRMFPTDILRLDYHEPGMMFAGCATFRDGLVGDSHVDDGPSVARIAREIFGHEDDE